jgi:16S rRNA (cytosine967-C5)-methyltransferase
VLYRARPQIIAYNVELQRQLLERAARWVRPGGTLVYSVCSLEPQEGEQVIEQFLVERESFTLAAPPELAFFDGQSKGEWLRILPGLLEAEGGLDGFFIARLVRRG